MGTLSFASLVDTSLFSLWDNSEILKNRLADGRTFEQLVAEIRRGLGVANGQLLAMPGYGDMIAVQDIPELEYPIGVSNGFGESTEYATPTPKRGATTGHMLPIKGYDRALGWTWRYLTEARRDRLDADVGSVMTDLMELWQGKLLTRFFKAEAETVGATSGASVPFADGGTADANYVPPVSPRGESFTSSHNHYKRVSALSTTNVDAHVEDVWEHGHNAPFIIVIPDADLVSWQALANWRKPTFADLNYQAVTTATARIGDVGMFAGFYESPRGVCYVWTTPRIPTNYYGIFKAYGKGDPRNPLRVRINPRRGFGFDLVPGQWVNNPLTMAVVYTEFGVGTGENRTNGLCAYINGSGSYVTPTVTYIGG